MDIKDFQLLLQEYLENSPLIVLGSGASMQYELPSMSDLKQKIMDSHDRLDSFDDYKKLFEILNSDNDLESSIDKAGLSPQLQDEIRRIVWEAVNEGDLRFFDKNPISPDLHLIALIKKIITPTPNKAVIVTTNYDRLPEYAADQLGATIVNGFEGTLIKKFEIPNLQLKNRRNQSRERVVDIWKVHGSLDWFASSEGALVSFPLTRIIPKELNPLIIPPGKDKYSATHNEPYRTIIAEADKAFERAGSYLCIGYGFNDAHIQPKLLTQISNGKPIVVLAKKITDACQKYIVENNNVKKFIVIESDETDNGKTKIHGNGNIKETYDGQYWQLDKFLSIW